MGREATAQCQWAEEAALCKVLLETDELILRGGLRRRVPLSLVTDISVENEQLRFRAGEDQVALALGSDMAKRWAKAMTTPPPSLAKKLGISPASYVLLIGKVESDELRAAISEASPVSSGQADLVLACVKTRDDLDRMLDQLPKHPSLIPPLWIVYPRGKSGSIGESIVRETLRDRGFLDTKVASVSAEFTALRFVNRSR